jgi:hypothetical protein
VSNGTVQLTIDGIPITVPKDTTIFDAARMHGIAIRCAINRTRRPSVFAGCALWIPVDAYLPLPALLRLRTRWWSPPARTG